MLNRVLYRVCVFGSLVFVGTRGFSRSIYLNGQDISSSRNQQINNANVRVDASGNVIIIAPHYQVVEENQYLPIGRPSSGEKLGNADHVNPQLLPNKLSKVGPSQKVPFPNDKQSEKKDSDNPATPDSQVVESDGGKDRQDEPTQGTSTPDSSPSDTLSPQKH